MIEKWYGRLGARYPGLAIAAVLRLQHLVFVVEVAVVAWYVPMTVTDFVVLSAASMAAQALYDHFTLRRFRERLAPVVDWLAGDRGVIGAAAAWREAASIPYDLLRLWVRGGYPLAAMGLWTGFATWLLDLPWWGFGVLLAASIVGTGYSNAFASLLLERAFDPVVADLARELEEDADPRSRALPLRRRLLFAVPGLNVVTGLVAVGIAAPQGGIDQMAAALGISLAIALTFAYALTFLLASSVVAPVDRLRAATMRVGSGDLGTRVPVAASDEMGELTRAFNGMVAGLEERERLRDAFGTFVDPELAERIARGGIDLRGEELELSVLFLDVRGFTSFAEEAEAREVVARLNALWEEVVPVIVRHGGHANKFIGDGLLAVFGAPQRLDDHARSAVGAACEIARCVRERFAGDVSVGIGVHSGPALVGTVGGGGRLDFTVIGDTVNTAARVETATRTTGDDVLITAATLGYLGEDAGFVEREAVPLKGKREVVRIFAPAPAEIAVN